MVLDVAERPTLVPNQRAIVPACLQTRAPLNYELRDEDNRRVVPTLAGYMLDRGTVYRLRVTTQDRDPRDWTLRLSAKRSLIHPGDKDEVDGESRVIAFEAASAKDQFSQIDSVVSVLHVHLDFEDGREPYRFAVPVVLRAGRMRFLGSVVLSVVLAYLTTFLSRSDFAVPTITQVILALVILGLLVFGSLLRDHCKLHQRAIELASGSE